MLRSAAIGERSDTLLRTAMRRVSKDAAARASSAPCCRTVRDGATLNYRRSLEPPSLLISMTFKLEIQLPKTFFEFVLLSAEPFQ
jgi:hypothetical protein